MPPNFLPHPKPRRPSPCHRHPEQPLTPLCAPCLRERLSVLNPSSGDAGVGANATFSSSSASSVADIMPQLRRCKSFSVDKCESLGIGLSYEPRRRSCEVRGRSTLVDLFTVDDEGEGEGGKVGSISKCKVESVNLGLLGGTYPVPEITEEEDDESDYGIRVSADVIASSAVTFRGNVDEEVEDSRTIKEFIDLELKSSKPAKRDFKEIAGSFWIAASVFSKKLQKWKKKQKNERPDGNCNGRLGEMQLDRLRGRRLRDTQSEVGDYGFGRRSCDTDPRVSVDLGRASIDGARISVDGIGKRFFDADPRYSLDLARASIDCGGISVEEAKQRCFDPPRASWDGRTHGKNVPRGTTPVISVIENAMATVYGFDNRTLIAEKVNAEKESENAKKVSNQSDSFRKNTVLTQEEDGGAEMHHSTKLLITEKELMGSRMSAVKDDSSDSFDTTSKDMTSSASSSSTGTVSKKSVKWGKFLNVWGFLGLHKQHKANEQFNRMNRKCSIAGNGDEVSSDSKWKLTRSQSVSSFKRHEGGGGALERNRSTKYSPSERENGTLRFYLTPLRSSRRSKLGKNRLDRPHSLAGAVLKAAYH